MKNVDSLGMMVIFLHVLHYDPLFFYYYCLSTIVGSPWLRGLTSQIFNLSKKHLLGLIILFKKTYFYLIM